MPLPVQSIRARPEVINEDPLGLDVVYLQAKRYQTDNVVGVDKIREFAGSLDEKRSTKGVFVTTSRFAPAARAYAQRSPKRLILIDGEELGRLLVDYGVGVRVFRTVALKRVDLDYFAPEDEGKARHACRPSPPAAAHVAVASLSRGRLQLFARA